MHFLLLLALAGETPVDELFAARHVRRVLVAHAAGHEPTVLGHLAELHGELDRLYRTYPGLERVLAARPVERYVLMGSANLRVGPAVHSGWYDGVTVWLALYTDHGRLAVFRHELGHHIYSTGLVARAGPWRAYYAGHSPDWWRRHVSDYATRGPEEAFAEVFKFFTAPDYRPGSLPIELESWLAQALAR